MRIANGVWPLSLTFLDFDSIFLATNWVALGSLICCVFLLLSFVCLPVARTSRHYLTIGLVVGVGLLSVCRRGSPDMPWLILSVGIRDTALGKAKHMLR